MRKKISKYCRRCKKWVQLPIEGDIELEGKDYVRSPRRCMRYCDEACRRQTKIKEFLRFYFPKEDLSIDLYDSLASDEIVGLSTEQVIREGEEFSYWSIRIPLPTNRPFKKIRSREVWRCKTEDEARMVMESLNTFTYYWIPTEVIGAAFVRKVYLDRFTPEDKEED
jgi:hypothetical protein